MASEKAVDDLMSTSHDALLESNSTVASISFTTPSTKISKLKQKVKLWKDRYMALRKQHIPYRMGHVAKLKTQKLNSYSQSNLVLWYKYKVQRLVKNNKDLAKSLADQRLESQRYFSASVALQGELLALQQGLEQAVSERLLELLVEFTAPLQKKLTEGLVAAKKQVELYKTLQSLTTALCSTASCYDDSQDIESSLNRVSLNKTGNSGISERMRSPTISSKTANKSPGIQQSSNRQCRRVLPMVMGHVLQKPMVTLPKMDLQLLRSIQRENREAVRQENELDMTLIDEHSEEVLDDEFEDETDTEDNNTAGEVTTSLPSNDRDVMVIDLHENINQITSNNHRERSASHIACLSRVPKVELLRLTSRINRKCSEGRAQVQEIVNGIHNRNSDPTEPSELPHGSEMDNEPVNTDPLEGPSWLYSQNEVTAGESLSNSTHAQPLTSTDCITLDDHSLPNPMECENEVMEKQPTLRTRPSKKCSNTRKKHATSSSEPKQSDENPIVLGDGSENGLVNSSSDNLPSSCSNTTSVPLMLNTTLPNTPKVMLQRFEELEMRDHRRGRSRSRVKLSCASNSSGRKCEPASREDDETDDEAIDRNESLHSNQNSDVENLHESGTIVKTPQNKFENANANAIEKVNSKAVEKDMSSSSQTEKSNSTNLDHIITVAEIHNEDIIEHVERSSRPNKRNNKSKNLKKDNTKQNSDRQVKTRGDIIMESELDKTVHLNEPMEMTTLDNSDKEENLKLPVKNISKPRSEYDLSAMEDTILQLEPYVSAASMKENRPPQDDNCNNTVSSKSFKRLSIVLEDVLKTPDAICPELNVAIAQNEVAVPNKRRRGVPVKNKESKVKKTIRKSLRSSDAMDVGELTPDEPDLDHTRRERISARVSKTKTRASEADVSEGETEPNEIPTQSEDIMNNIENLSKAGKNKKHTKKTQSSVLSAKSPKNKNTGTLKEVADSSSLLKNDTQNEERCSDIQTFSPRRKKLCVAANDNSKNESSPSSIMDRGNDRLSINNRKRSYKSKPTSTAKVSDNQETAKKRGRPPKRKVIAPKTSNMIDLTLSDDEDFVINENNSDLIDNSENGINCEIPNESATSSDLSVVEVFNNTINSDVNIFYPNVQLEVNENGFNTSGERGPNDLLVPTNLSKTANTVENDSFSLTLSEDTVNNESVDSQDELSASFSDRNVENGDGKLIRRKSADTASVASKNTHQLPKIISVIDENISNVDSMVDVVNSSNSDLFKDNLRCDSSGIGSTNFDLLTCSSVEINDLLDTILDDDQTGHDHRSSEQRNDQNKKTQIDDEDVTLTEEFNNGQAVVILSDSEEEVSFKIPSSKSDKTENEQNDNCETIARKKEVYKNKIDENVIAAAQHESEVHKNVTTEAQDENKVYKNVTAEAQHESKVDKNITTEAQDESKVDKNVTAEAQDENKVDKGTAEEQDDNSKGAEDETTVSSTGGVRCSHPRRNAAKVVSYKELPITSKLRQGDPISSSIYKQPPASSRKKIKLVRNDDKRLPKKKS